MLSIGNLGFRLLARTPSGMFDVRAFSPRSTRSETSVVGDARGDRYRVKPSRTLLHRAVGALPPFMRESVAEAFLRRAGAPGPAAEHAFQYLLSTTKAKKKAKARHFEEATVAKGADSFYQRQYRQYFNTAMGAFAMTAKMALVASSGTPHGRVWRRCRPTQGVMLEAIAGAPPIVVINRQTAAVPLLLPNLTNPSDLVAAARWLTGHGTMPALYEGIVAGEEVPCGEPGVRARSRAADGALLDVVDAVTSSGKLAILALHPYDPDAMALHITLFGSQILTPKFVEEDYGLDRTALDPWRNAAMQRERLLLFCVGGTEELFTQCSQNLFVKRPGGAAPGQTQRSNAWRPSLPLERLLDAQFEILQITASASGLPGVSPRNGDRGKAAFVGRRDGKTFVLIPYFPGNAVHGHAAKLWSNAYGELVIWDDHCALNAVTLSGPAWVVAHRTVEQDFPSIAVRIASRQKRNGATAPNPEYWFLQQVVDLIQQREPLAANLLDPSRPTCTIHAGGLAHHGKKPAYFSADTLPPYDQDWQHRREAAGRPIDPTGKAHHRWAYDVAPALAARQVHLGGVST